MPRISVLFWSAQNGDRKSPCSPHSLFWPPSPLFTTTLLFVPRRGGLCLCSCAVARGMRSPASSPSVWLPPNQTELLARHGDLVKGLLRVMHGREWERRAGAEVDWGEAWERGSQCHCLIIMKVVMTFGWQGPRIQRNDFGNDSWKLFGRWG